MWNGDDDESGHVVDGTRRMKPNTNWCIRIPDARITLLPFLSSYRFHSQEKRRQINSVEKKNMW